MLEINKSYTTEELKKELNISIKSWNTKREELLEYFYNFFNYDIVTEGRNKYYVITEIYGDYEPMPRKKKSDEIKSYYAKETKKIVEKEPWNTGSNIARNIINKDKNKYNHAQATISNYVRPVLREEYDVTEKRWMRLMDTYEPLTEEQELYLQECLTVFRKNNSTIFEDLISDLECGLATKAEIMKYAFDKQYAEYNRSMDLFKIKFGFRPIKVPKLEKKNMGWGENPNLDFSF